MSVDELDAENPITLASISMRALCHLPIVFLLASSGIALTEASQPKSQKLTTYSLIEPGLYLGAYLPEPPPGTKAVLNVCEFEDLYKCDHQLWSAIPDRAPSPSLEWLIKQVAFVAEQRKAGRTTYVHCFAGISRGPMVVAAYLMLKHNWTRDQALQFLHERRPQVNPNPAFMKLLGVWERELKKAATRKRDN